MGATLNEQIIMTEELARIGAPHLPVQGLNHIGPILMEFGTDAQKKDFKPFDPAHPQAVKVEGACEIPAQ